MTSTINVGIVGFGWMGQVHAKALTRIRQGSEASVRFMAINAPFFSLLEVENIDKRFVDVLRKYDEIGDLSNKGRRKMPALMRGADARYLTLTRRQVDLIRKVAQRDIFAADPPKQPDGPAQPAPTTEKTS